MRRVEYALWYLPPRSPRAKPYKSAWKMTAEEAAAKGAVGQVPGSVEIRLLPETDGEKLRATMHYQSAGHDAVKPPGKT
jgi:hypothetical protein